MYPETASGGVTTSGTATFRIVSYRTGSSGVTVGGTSRVTSNLFQIASGGVIVGGTVRFDEVIVISGGVLAGGTATVLVTASKTASGGVVAGGTAVVKKTSFLTATGGVVISGTSVNYIAKVVASSGGVIVGGTGPELLKHITVGTGGAIVGGTADFYIIHKSDWSDVADGGITIGGSSKTKPIGFCYAVASGGITIGSTAYAVWGRIYTSSGGITMGGTSQPNEATYRYIPQGRKNILIGSTTIATMIANATGGVICGGSAVLNRRDLSYVATGGIDISGDPSPMQASYHYAPSGNKKDITIGGSATCLPGQYSYVASGGILAYGRCEANFTLGDEVCQEELGCIALKPNRRKICLVPDRYYGDCKVYGECKISTALLPPIIKCRQKLILPKKDRNPRFPKH